MTIHLLKLSVGSETVEDLVSFQKNRIAERVAASGEPFSYHVTRNFPKRADEILNGGSMYWIIRGVIRLRQPILRLDRVTDDRGRSACRIVLADHRIRVKPRTFRSFQGWRYFRPEDTPPDLVSGAEADEEALPIALQDHLKEMGLS